MRVRLRRALFELIESHDQELSRYVGEGSLALDSYKEYIELFAHSLKQTVSSREGVAYLLQAMRLRLEQGRHQPRTRDALEGAALAREGRTSNIRTPNIQSRRRPRWQASANG
ncbi:MAG: hypothetical protein WDN28_32055 [Chthoniobacter sp.]